MKKMKRILAILLSMVMLITVVPGAGLSALADSFNRTDIFRITLTWNASPRDLDSHLEGEDSAGNPFHIFYSDMEAYDTDGSLLASLDIDDTSGYGPENTTIFKSLPNTTFRFYVHNYSGEAPISGCGAVVELYKNDNLIARYTPPANGGDGEYWNLFQIYNGNVYVVNKIAGDSISNGKSATINASNLSKNDIVITPKIAIDEGNDLTYTASDVTMKKSTESASIEQMAGSFRLQGNQSAAYSVTLFKEEYRNYIIPDKVLQSWKRINLGNVLLDTISSPIVFHSAFLRKDRKDGKPYISTVFCQKSSNTSSLGDKYVEIQHDTQEVYQNEKYNIIISAEDLGGKSCTFYIAQDEQHKISSSTGVFNSVDLFSKLDFQKTTYAYLVTEDNVISELMPINIKKNPETQSDKLVDALKSGKLSVLGDNTFSVQIPSSVPLFGDAEISLDAFKIPAGFELDGNSLKVSIGANIFNVNSEFEKGSTEYTEWKKNYFKDWKDAIKSVNDLKKKENSSGESGDSSGESGDSSDKDKSSDKEKNKKAVESFKKKWGLGEKGKSKEKNWDLDFLGYIELERIDGNWITKEAAISVEGSFSFEYTVQGAFWIIPTYFSLEAGCSLGATGVLSRVIADSSIPFEFDLTLKLEPQLGLGAGVGYKKALSAGLYAEATLPITFEIGARHLMVKATGEIGVEARVFVFKGKKKLLDGTLNILDKYFGATKDPNKMYASGPSANSEEEIEYYVLDRDYLENTSGWLSGAKKWSLRGGMQVDGLRLTDLQTSIYEDAMPRVVAFGDKMLMAWIGDSAERDNYNRMRLMYSVYDGSVWSEPTPVCDDGFNDDAPIIATDGQDVYFAWQKLCKTLTEEDTEDINDIANCVEIFTAKYDAESGTIRNVRQETENDSYDYAHHISSVNGNAKLYYVSNNDSLDFTDNTIYQADFAGKSVAVAENLNYIVDMAVSQDANGEAVVSYLLDADGDTTTADDLAVYTRNVSARASVNETAKILEAQTGASQVYVTDIFYGDFCGESTLFAVSGKEIFHINSDGVGSLYMPDASISGDVNYITKDGVPMLYWTSNVEIGNAVYYSAYENGEWTEPVAVSDTNTHVSGVTIVNYNGEIKGACTSAELLYNEETGSYEIGQTNLCAIDIADKYDIEIDYIRIEEENIHIGEKTPVFVCVKNNGNTPVENVEFTISDELGYSQSKNIAINLSAGAATVVELEYTAPANYNKTKLTVAAEFSDFETNLENNAVSTEIGLPKIVISDATIYKTGKSYVVSAFVTNESDVPASNIGIVSKLDDNVVHSSGILGTIAPRESCYVDFEILASEIPFVDNAAKMFITVEGENASENTVAVLIEQFETECLHPVVYETVVEPTCIKSGKTSVICAGCKAVIEETVIPEKGHCFDQTDICSGCGAERIVENQVKTIVLPVDGDCASLLFTPESDGDYWLFSEVTNPVYIQIIDEKTQEVYAGDGNEENNALKLQNQFMKGVSYILQFENVSDEDITLPITIARPIAATGVQLSKEEYTGCRWTEYRIDVSLLPMNAIPESLQWSSSHPECVEVYDDGTIYLKAAGTATITVTTENGLSDECVVTVLDYPTINQGEQKTVEITETKRYAYFYFTPNTTGTYAYYSSSSSDTLGSIFDADMEEIASDDDDGESRNFRIECMLTAGITYILRAEYYSSEKTGTFEVQVEKLIDAEEIRITQGDFYSASIGSDYQLTAELLPQGANEQEFIWTSADESIVYVDEDGQIYLNKEGTTTITVSTESGLSDSITIEVAGCPEIVLEQEVVITVGDNSCARMFSFTPAVTGTYIFCSYDNDFDTYGYLYDFEMNELTSNDDSGDDGNFKISYKLIAGEKYYFKSEPYYEGSTGNYTVKLTRLPVATSMIIQNGDLLSIGIGDTGRLLVEFAPENCEPEDVTWLSDNESVVIVDEEGYFEVVGSGTAQITATSENGLVATCIVEVADLPIIRCDEEKTITEAESGVGFYKFIPDESGDYYFYSYDNDFDTCGYVFDSEMNELASNDDFGEDSNFRVEYCFAAGEIYYLMSEPYGGYDQGEYCVRISRREHTLMPVAYQEASCTEDGHIAHQTCSDCDLLFDMDGAVITTVIIPRTGHTYDSTCDSDCDTCGAIREVRHHWIDATCADAKTCSVCGETEGDALGHNYRTVVTAPNCVNGGYTTYTCSACGDSYVADRTEALGHDMHSDVTIAATCEEEGVLTYWCPNCDYQRSELIPKLKSHTYDSGKVTKKATCKAAGIKTYTCTVCGSTKTEAIAKIAHTYKAATCTAPKTCKICGVTSGKALGHKYTNACDTSCNTCKATRKITHNYKTVTKAATQSANGYTVKRCSVCKKETGKTSIYKISTIKLSKTTYTYNGKVQRPSVVIKDSKGKTIASSNYTVTYASGRKNVGTYKVTIKFKGKYSGTKTLTFKINPAGTTVKSLTAAKKSLKVAITKKSTQVTGYQIQYSTRKSFSSYKTKSLTSYKKTALTLTGLKTKTTYYVRVRTYKTVNGVKYYSGWSTIKYKKTK